MHTHLEPKCTQTHVMTFQNKHSHPLVIINTHVVHMNASLCGTPKGVMLQSNNQLTYLPLVRLPQSLLIELHFHWGSSSFKGLLVPHARRCGTAEADAPINVYRSPPKCSDAPKVDSPCVRRHHIRVEPDPYLRAFYHPLELP